jgi:hypothetical protein
MPQGKYGLPVYPIYDRTVRTIRDADPQKAVGLCMSFLSPRIQRTPGFELSESELEEVAGDLCLATQSVNIDEKVKALGLVILAETTEDDPFGLEDSVPSGNPHLAYIGASVLEEGRHIVSRLDECVEPFWEAKIEEGVEGGEKVGPPYAVVSKYGNDECLDFKNAVSLSDISRARTEDAIFKEVSATSLTSLVSVRAVDGITSSIVARR